MAGVFLSYRSKDGDFAVLLYAWLVERFGAERVFWDREDIDPGSDFRQVLSTKLRGCDALVALIGPQWTPSPWIVREIGGALRRRVLVLPVRLADAPPVEARLLPTTVRRFASLQTLETRDLRFRDRFLKALDRVVTEITTPDTTAAVGADDFRGRRLSELLRDQTDEQQRRALELLQADQTDDALDVLNRSYALLMALIEFRPGDTSLELRLGYLYKDLAQVFEASEPAQFNRYVDMGLQTFQRLVELRLPNDQLASCWNGLGNMHLHRGDFDKAVDCCRRAVHIVPGYSYAWNDLLIGLQGQAGKGKVNLPAMRHALARLKATAGADPLLQPGIARMQAFVTALGTSARVVKRGRQEKASR